ncbi:MAG: RNA polymerase sigma-70 factor [Desulfobacterales bacterium]|jgi:RNA polymerase sigma-70 factor (ECF subfamily)
MRFRKQKETSYLTDPDVECMLKVKEGDRVAFEILMRKYYPRILNFVYRFLGNRQLSEDLTQDVFLKVYKNARRYRPRSKFQTWLFTIAKNSCLNELRRNRRQMASLEESITPDERVQKKEISDPHADPAGDFLQKEKKVLIQAAINELPENQRMAVILRRYENFSYVEIATALNVTDKAVKSLLSRAKVNLRKKLAGIVDPD